MAGYVDLPEGFEIVSYGDTPKPNISDDLPEGFEIVSYGEQPATKPAVNQAAPKQPTTQQPTKTLTGGVSVNVTNPNKSQSTWRNAGRQFARGTARALAPEKLENWAVGSKNDEALLNQYIQSGVPTYEQIDKDYRAGKIDKAKLKVLVNKRKTFDDLMADAEYRAVRNKNIGKGALEVGTAAIGGGAGTAAAKVGMQAIKQGSKQLAKQALKEVGKTTAIGAGYGASEGVIDENINPITNALKQAAIWGTTHAATLGAGKGIQAAANSKVGKAVGKAVSDAKAKVDDKVFDAITSTEAGIKALQAVENAKNAIGKELTKERTFKQHKQSKATKPQEVIENMPEASGRPVEVETGINTQETNLPRVDEALVSSKVIDNVEIPQGTPIAQRKIGETGNLKESALAKNAKKSDEVADAIKNKPVMYEAITNAETIAQAEKEIAENISGVYEDISKKLSNEKAAATALDVEKARQVYIELQKQGRFDEATDLLQSTSKQSSKLGQAVQAFSLWSKTTPEGAQLYAQKLLDKYNNGVRKDLQKRLSREQLQEIGQAFKELNESGLTGRKLEIATAKAMKKVYKVVPKTAAQKLDGYRIINMLLSGKSRIKDFILTGKNAYDTAIDETIAGGIDAVRSAVTKDKTRYVSANPFAGMKDWFKGFKKGAKEGVEDIQNKVNTARSGEVGRYGLPADTVFEMPDFEGSILKRALTVAKYPVGSAEKLLKYTLQVPDRAFFEARFASSLANQMRARKLNTPTQDMINSAFKEAKRAVFQEDRFLTDTTRDIANFIDERTVRRLEKALERPEGTLPSVSKTISPFLKTPTNVTAQGLEGLHGSVSGLVKLKRAIRDGNPEAIRAAELLAGRGFRGLGELGTGIAVGKGAIDNIKHNFGADYTDNEVTGLKPNSVIIGDKAFSMENMQTNLPFFTGVGLGEDGVGKAWDNTYGVVSELPGVKLMNEIGKAIYNKKGGKALKNLTASYITSLVPLSGESGEIRNWVDPIAREVTDPNLLKYYTNRVANKIPGVSNLLPAKNNKIGENVMVNNIKNPVARAASEAIDFGVRNYKEPPKLLEESKKLAEKSKSNAFLIDKAPKTITIKKGETEEKKTLNAEEYSEFQEKLGKLKLENRKNYIPKARNKSKKKMKKIANELSKADTLAEQQLIHDMFGGDEPKAIKPTSRGYRKRSVPEMIDLMRIKKQRKRLNKRAKGN